MKDSNNLDPMATPAVQINSLDNPLTVHLNGSPSIASGELVEITSANYPVDIDLVYASADNLAGRPVYAAARCALRPEAAACLLKAAVAAQCAGYRIKVFDAYRPPRAQRIFWALCPDPRYIADANLGSNHTRGTAVDVTLLDDKGVALDMGTGFDAMEDRSHHDRDDLPVAVQRNRSLLLGIMLRAGFRSINTEWWHYELPDSKSYALLDDPIVTAVDK